MKTLPGGSANVSLFRRGKSDFSARDAVRFFREILAPFWTALSTVTIMTIVTVLAQIAALILVRPLLDEIIIPQKLDRLPLWGGLMFAAITVSALSQWGVGGLIGRLGSQMADVLRQRLHTHALHLPVRFFDAFPSGEVTSRVLSDTIAVERFVIERLPFAAVNVLTLLVAGVALFAVSPVLGLLACVPLPLFVISARWFNRIQHADLKAYFDLNARLNSNIHETVNGIKAIKAACRENQGIAAFNAMSEESQRIEFRINHWNVLYSEAGAWFLSLGVAGLWYAGAYCVGENLSAGALVAITGIARFFYAPLNAVGPFIHQWAGAVAASGRLTEFLALAPENEILPAETAENSRPAENSPATALTGAITYKNVRFSYLPGTEVIHGVNFRIEPGQMVGLVGRSGAGKSTLINLLCRFYLPDSGEILLNDRPAGSFPLSAYRRQIGLVLQEPYLFRMSIADNIRFAKPDASDAEVLHAAELAQATGFISKLADGMATVVGDQGVRLSVGEIQRIAIARALLQNPQILILDEATSNLDAETEVQIQQALAELIKDRTTIAIAHRLSTLRHANRLLVIDNGNIVEDGTHAELAAKPHGVYAGLINAQTRIHSLQAEQNIWKM